MVLENLSLGSLDSETIQAVFASGIIGGLIAISILFIILFVIAVYIYQALAWRTIARKLKYKKDWLAWIPIANISMMLELGGYHWAWVFLILIPVFGWIALFIFIIIATWRIFERRNYPGWYSLSLVIPQVGGILYLVAIGFVAWQDKAGTGVPKPSEQVKKAPVKRKVKKKK